MNISSHLTFKKLFYLNTEQVGTLYDYHSKHRTLHGWMLEDEYSWGGLGHCRDVVKNAGSGANTDMTDRLEVDAGAAEFRRLFRLPQVGTHHPH